MEIYLLKLTVTPLLMWLVSLVGRRWGGLAGGILAGMPITSGPISIYLAIEQGPAFADQAASGALIGIGAVMASYAAYIDASRRRGIGGSILTALGTYGIAACALFGAGSEAASVAVSVLAFLLIVRPRPEIPTVTASASRPAWDMPARMAASTVLVLTVTGCAAHLGPTLSGLVSPIPVIAWPLAIFAHLQGGSAEAQSTIRGTAAGSCGIIIFNLVVSRGFEVAGIVPTYLVAFGLSCLASTALGYLLSHTGRSAVRAIS
ncbi:hypothetical protein [Methylobacterium sp. SyP6R]|uniref:hypothetical protein n=1 Tax=Methylobacterium sp. SyP6R TaxID=2718876 RepID=UPI001F30D8FF|nr:hypothetical protein [Methylobacterium sp. SyP6R]MCF4130095.1 hypothetical protein [Methylobacterium sp. SyP6R]